MVHLGQQPEDMSEDELREQIDHWVSQVHLYSGDSDPGLAEAARLAADKHIEEALRRGITYRSY